MRYALDTEFIDTPTCSALISLGIVAEDGREIYLEFDFPQHELTPWLRTNVVPYLEGKRKHSTGDAEDKLRTFFDGDTAAKVWCYYGAYDWYWFCRIFGGFMAQPNIFGMRFHELAEIGHPKESGNQHNALDDARGIMAALKRDFAPA